MPYRTETYELTLEEAGHPEFKLMVVDPDFVDSAQRNRVVDAMTILHYRQYTKSGLPPEERWAVRALEDFVLGSIQKWNLPYPPRWAVEAERNKVIPLVRPEGAPEEWSPLDALPSYVYKAIVGKIGGRLLEPPKSPEGAG